MLQHNNPFAIRKNPESPPNQHSRSEKSLLSTATPNKADKQVNQEQKEVKCPCCLGRGLVSQKTYDDMLGLNPTPQPQRRTLKKTPFFSSNPSHTASPSSAVLNTPPQIAERGRGGEEEEEEGEEKWQQQQQPSTLAPRHKQISSVSPLSSSGDRKNGIFSSSASNNNPTASSTPASPSSSSALRGASVKLIFLDVDGVLHGLESFDNFTPSCMKCLVEISKRGSADGIPVEIVLSSTWRTSEMTIGLVNRVLRKYGLNPIVGCTPIHTSGTRSAEILAYIAKFESSESNNPVLTHWVGIDDIDLAADPLVEGQCVLTNEHTGLVKGDVELAVEVLNMPPRPHN